MYLKFEYEGKDKFLKFEEGKLTVGRGSQADVIIRAEGVSRLHLELERNSEGFFVKDLNSTNGTLINDVRIEANHSTEFHSFFPVNMGGNVLIKLVEKDSDYNDDMGTDPGNNSLSQLDRTGEINLGSSSYRKSRKTKKRDLSWLKPLIPSFFLIGAFIFLSIFYIWQKGSDSEPPMPVVKAPVKKEVIVKEETSLVSRKNILQIIKLVEPTLKCQTDWVQKICKELSNNRTVGRLEGLILVKDALFVMIDTDFVKRHINEKYPLELKNKNKYVNRFERLYPGGNIEQFQLKYNYNLYQDNPELNKRVFMLYDVLTINSIKYEELKAKVKSVIFIEVSKSLSEAYRTEKPPYFIFNEIQELEPFYQNDQKVIKGIVEIAQANDPRIIEEVNVKYLSGIKIFKQLIPELMSSESLKKFNQK